MKIHSGETPYQCTECDKSFKERRSLTDHLRVHSGEPQPYVCDVCSKSFSHRTTFANHMKTHSKETHHCNECGKSFKWKKGLQRHTKVHKREEDPYTCQISFASKFAIQTPVDAPKTTNNTQSEDSSMSELDKRQNEGVRAHPTSLSDTVIPCLHTSDNPNDVRIKTEEDN